MNKTIDILEKHGIVRIGKDNTIYIAATAVPSKLNDAIIEIIDSRWIDVNEAMPEQGQFCLIYNSISVEPSVFDRNEFYRYPNEITGDRCSTYHFDKTKCTHWMPLPSPPKPTPNA